jgi:hypothetical protein
MPIKSLSKRSQAFLGCVLILMLSNSLFAERQTPENTQRKKYNTIKKKRHIVIEGVEIPRKDNGFDLYWGGKLKAPLRYHNKTELVGKVKKLLRGDACILELRLYGHGNSGVFYMGNGQSPAHAPCTSMGAHREAEWQTAFADIKEAFCRDGVLVLHGCYVGRGEEGKKLLVALASFFQVKVIAPMGIFKGGEDYKGKWLEAAPDKTVSIKPHR